MGVNLSLTVPLSILVECELYSLNISGIFLSLHELQYELRTRLTLLNPHLSLTSTDREKFKAVSEDLIREMVDVLLSQISLFRDSLSKSVLNPEKHIVFFTYVSAHKALKDLILSSLNKMRPLVLEIGELCIEQASLTKVDDEIRHWRKLRDLTYDVQEFIHLYMINKLEPSDQSQQRFQNKLSKLEEKIAEMQEIK